MTTKKVAIACQGGGTHAAFTWGVLIKMLETKQQWDAGFGDGQKFEITALSGTSAGALCALATWYGLVPNTADPECGTIDKAIERLDFLWKSFAAATPMEKTHDATVAALLELQAKGAPFKESSPYQIYGDLVLKSLEMLGARKEYLGFPGLLGSLCPNFNDIDWPRVAEMNRRAVAGSIEIYSGNFEAFDSFKTLEDMELRPSPDDKDQYQTTRWRMRRALSLAGVAASGTLPEYLKAQRIPNQVFPTCTPGRTVWRDGYYWDGLYSQNPPVRLLLDYAEKEEKPDEIWVIRINPQEIDFEQKITSLEDIKDRQNDLAGNLSLNQELDHIRSMNNWLVRFGDDDHPLLANRKIIEIRTIKMRRETAWGLKRTSKFHRSAKHFESLYREGREVAEEWLEGWRERGPEFDSYPNDARYALEDEPAGIPVQPRHRADRRTARV